ncbi:MAG: trypsin-like peptidase domain-containing protein [Pirellulales bacterium]
MRSVYAFGLLLGLFGAATLRAQPSDPFEAAINAAIEKVAPSLVRIETLGGLDKVGAVAIGTGPTTGLIASANGYIVSSAFNFSQKPSQILVYLQDGSRHPAKLIATDHSNRLVLLKIEVDKLPVAKAASLKDLKTGQTTLALGRAFESDKPNLSVGILSAVNRIWGKAVQTDAKISSNNYGGPLIDLRGDVIGILAPLSPQPGGDDAGVEWYDSGIGFAVPLETINRVLPRLEKGEDLYAGLLGIGLRGNDVYGDPAALATVQPNSPAAQAGWKPGDIIVDVAGKPITRQAELKHALGPYFADDTLKVTVKRGKELIEKELKLVGKLAAYQHPFLGVLPLRESEDAKGLAIRGSTRNHPPRRPA